MNFVKSLTGAAMAVLVLGAFVGTATAGRLRSTSTTLRATFSRVIFDSVIGHIDCVITLEGTLRSATINKNIGSQVGSITAANLGACASNSATILRETLPWPILYGLFVGTLPNIVGIGFDLSNFSIRLREPLFTCLLRSNTLEPVTMTPIREAGGALTTASLANFAPTSCGAPARITSSAGPITVAGAATRITVTLI